MYKILPENKPPKDGYYLISVKPEFILKVGLSPSPNILIAKYNSANREWSSILGTDSLGLGNIANEVIAWCDLPTP